MEESKTNLIYASLKLSESQWQSFIRKCLHDQDFLMRVVSDIYPTQKSQTPVVDINPTQKSQTPSVSLTDSDEYHIDEDELLMLQEVMMPHIEDVEHQEYDWAQNTNTIQPSKNKSKTNRTDISMQDRAQIITALFKLADNNYRLPKKAISDLAVQYGKHKTTLTRIWESAVRADKRSERINFCNERHKCGRKRNEFDEDRLKAVPQTKRTTIRQFASALDVCSSTVVRLMQRGVIRSHTSSIKPTLKPYHKFARLEFVLSKIIPGTLVHKPKFEALTNVIHIDEKQFMGSRQTQRYYLVMEELEPYRHTQSKNFIEKVMFMAAVARPIFGHNGECVFDGKIGIWPFTEEHVAMRSTMNRPKGTVITKPARSVNKETIRETIINKVIPAIKAKWPSWQTKCIWIQQDNARPHISPNDTDFCVAANTDGFEIKLMNQPAQSPDLNVLDLGFFNAIQAIQYKKFPTNVTELIKAVEDSFLEYDSKMVKFTWLQLQYVMIEILKSKGGNEYKSPHIGKEKLDRIGKLPFSVEVPQGLIDDTIQYLECNVADRRNVDPMPDDIEGYEVL